MPGSPDDERMLRPRYADLHWSLELAASDLAATTELSRSQTRAALMLAQEALAAAVFALDRHATGAARLSGAEMTEVVRLVLNVQHLMAAAIRTCGGREE